MNEKKLPSKDYFLLCEDFRMEGGNKTSLLGFAGSTGTVLNVPKQDNIALQSLACVISLLDGEGTFKTHLVIVSPSNVILAQGDPESITLRPGQTSNIGFKIAPFPVTEGSYRVHLNLDDTRYDYHFSVALIDQKPRSVS